MTPLPLLLLLSLLLSLTRNTCATLYEVKLVTNAAQVPGDFPTDPIFGMIIEKIKTIVPDSKAIRPGERVGDRGSLRRQRQLPESQHLRGADRATATTTEASTTNTASADPNDRMLQMSMCPKTCNAQNYRVCLAYGCVCDYCENNRRHLVEVGSKDLDVQSLEDTLSADANTAVEDYTKEQGFLVGSAIRVKVLIEEIV